MNSLPLITSGSQSIVAGAASIVGLAVGAVLVVLVLGVVGALVIVVVANRADPDPSGRRPFVVYLFGASFITIWTALIGSVAVVSSLVELIGRTTALSLGARHPVGDSVARGVVLGGLILIVSLITLAIHSGRGRSIVTEETSSSAPSIRVARSYGATVSFVAVLILGLALIAGVYAIFQLVAPGVFQARGRIPAVRSIIDAGWVVLASAAILVTHVGLAKPSGWTQNATAVVVEDVVVVESPGDGAV